MIVSGSRLRQMGWLVALAVCAALFLSLTFRVHAVNSEVLLAERQIIALKHETIMLETEFQTRASQRQLSEWNAVDFGYHAPRPDQYLSNERQLASLGSPAGPNAPSPIRVARADVPVEAAEPGEMRSPLTGRPVGLTVASAEVEAGVVFAEAFGDLIAEASPVRPAQARTMLSAEVSE
jgi:hypothetical protein